MGKYSALPLFVTLYGLGVVMLLSLCATGGDAFVFVIPPREELCVWENAKPSYFVTVQFQVLEGGHQDVDIKVPTFFHFKSFEFTVAVDFNLAADFNLTHLSTTLVEMVLMLVLAAYSSHSRRRTR
jgi:hypothetical protein